MNLVVLIPLLAWLIAHFIKFTTHAFKGDVDFRYFVGSGGVVSAHSAVVSALATTVGLLEGLNSTLFAISFIIASIIIYDSFGVRRAVGDHSAVLKNLVERNKLEQLYKVRPALGHTPREVLRGIGLGTSLGIAFTYQTWTPQVAFLAESAGSVTNSLEARLYLGFFVVALFGWMILRWRLKRKPVRKLESAKKLRRFIFWSVVPVALTGLIFVWLSYEGISGYDWRVWQVLSALILVGTQLFLGINYYPQLIRSIKRERNQKQDGRSRRSRKQKHK